MLRGNGYLVSLNYLLDGADIGLKKWVNTFMTARFLFHEKHLLNH